MEKIPPFSLLQTIEAVTRLGSFKRAAEELCITPSAISHRVRTVEETLGQPLFLRVGQGIEPTENAQKLSEATGVAMRDVGRAWDELSGRVAAGQYRVWCMTAFAEHFILPQMSQFRAKFSNFEIELTSNLFVDSPRRKLFDVIVGVGPHPDADWHIEDIQPMLISPITSPAALPDVIRDGKLFGPLFAYQSYPDIWEHAARHLNMDIHPKAKVLLFDSAGSACAAAEQGVGIALVPWWIAEKQVRNKSSILLGNGRIPTNSTYWLAIRNELHGLPIMSKFRRWLKARTSD